tara:strand:- start:3060 stop:3455 length:396 start_codon:yes stop_codon:yes gene_type:complete
MDKTKQIWYRFKNDQANLKNDCVDLIGKCYLLLGQKPETEQIVLMAQFLYTDLIERYGGMEMEKVEHAILEGLRYSNTGGFVNIRNLNQWIQEYKEDEHTKNRQGQITSYQKSKETQKLISKTINQAKQIK